MSVYPGFVIETRQKADILFGSSVPLPAATSFISDIRLVSGYALIAIFAVSDQAFGIAVEEACNPDDSFIQTQPTILSTLVAGQQQVCVRIQPCAPFMKMALGNLGAPMGILSFCARGLPLP